MGILDDNNKVNLDEEAEVADDVDNGEASEEELADGGVTQTASSPLARLVLRFPGGYIQTEKQANMVVVGGSVLLIVIALLIALSTRSRPVELEEMPTMPIETDELVLDSI